MQELHDAFFKEEAVETDPEVDLRAIQEAVETQLELEEAIAAAEHGEIELPSDALQPLTLAPAEEKPEEPPAAAVVAPAPEEAGTAGPSLHFEQVEQADGPISSRVVHDPAASNPTVAPANRATKNEAPARTFYDQDGKPVPFIAPEHKDAPAAWREPFNWQVFCAGMVDALLVLMCVAPVTIIAAAGGQDLMAQAEEGLSAAVPWNVVLAFWGSAFFFHVFLTFASVSWTGATVGGNLFKIFILSRESATRPQPLQTGVLAHVQWGRLTCLHGRPVLRALVESSFSRTRPSHGEYCARHCERRRAMSVVLPSLFQKAIDENFIQASTAHNLLLRLDARHAKELPLQMLFERHLPESFVLKHLAERHRLASVSFQDVLNLQRDKLSDFPEHLAKAYQCIPLEIEKKRCAIAVAEDKSAEELNQLSLALNLFVYPKITTRLHLELGFARLFDVWPPVESALWLEKEDLLSAPKTGGGEPPTEVAVPVAQQVLEGLASSCDHAALFVCSQRTLQLQSIWSGGRERPELEVEHLACGSTELWWKTLRQGKPFFGAFPFQGTLRLALSVTSQTTVYLLDSRTGNPHRGFDGRPKKRRPQPESDFRRASFLPRLGKVFFMRWKANRDGDDVRAVQEIANVATNTHAEGIELSFVSKRKVLVSCLRIGLLVALGYIG